MSIFDLDHISERPDNFTAGPRVGFLDNVSQGFEQQFRVDSPLALENEIQNRWLENLELLQGRTGETFRAPSLNPAIRDYALMQSGQTPAAPNPASAKFYNEQLALLQQADERIKALADPEVRSFADIVREVIQMQQDVEAKSADMSERSGFLGDIGQFIGAMGGAFTTRDPVSLFTLPLGGGGRTLAMRIGSEMAVGGTAAATVSPQVAENRELAGLPEHNLALDIAVGAVGAGVLRGAFEGAAAGFRRLSPDRAVDLPAMDLSDDQLRQMFENNLNSPRARAGEQILDDVAFLERNNPYGVGEAAHARFLAELQDVAKVIAGEPQTAVARVLSPIPFEMVEKAADFQIVKERAPEVWARVEEAQAAVRALDEEAATITSTIEETTLPQAVRLIDAEAADQLDALAARVNDPNLPEPARVAADLEAQAIITRVGEDRIAKALNNAEIAPKQRLRRIKSERRAANRRHKAAFKQAEVERVRLHIEADAFRRAQQTESVDLLGYATNLKPFIAPHLDHTVVAQRVARIDAEDKLIPDRASEMIQIAPDETGRFDIGLAEPVDGSFRFTTDDGDMSIEDALIDLREDDLLEEAMRTCLL